MYHTWYVLLYGCVYLDAYASIPLRCRGGRKTIGSCVEKVLLRATFYSQHACIYILPGIAILYMHCGIRFRSHFKYALCKY